MNTTSEWEPAPGTEELSAEEREAAWLQALADAHHEQLEDRDWHDDWTWCLGPGARRHDGPEADDRRKGGGR